MAELQPTLEQIQKDQLNRNFQLAIDQLRNLTCLCVLFVRGDKLDPAQKAYFHAEVVSLAKLYEPKEASV